MSSPAESTINRADAWKIIDSGVRVDLAFVLADRRRGTGGQYRDVKGVQKVQDDSPLVKSAAGIKRQRKDLVKHPNHGLHKTVNIHHPGNNRLHIYKVHYRLMHYLNGKRIIN